MNTLIYLILYLTTPESPYKDYELLVFNGEKHYIHKSIDVSFKDLKIQEKRHFERVETNLYKWEKTKNDMKKIYFSKNGNLSIFYVKKEDETLSFKEIIEKYKPNESYKYEGFGESFKDSFGGFESIKDKFRKYSNHLILN